MERMANVEFCRLPACSSLGPRVDLRYGCPRYLVVRSTSPRRSNHRHDPKADLRIRPLPTKLTNTHKRLGDVLEKKAEESTCTW